MKQVEARVDGIVRGVTDLGPGAGSSSEQEAIMAQELVKEVWEVVDQNYLDARGTGFDQARCTATSETASSAFLRRTTEAVR